MKPIHPTSYFWFRYDDEHLFNPIVMLHTNRISNSILISSMLRYIKGNAFLRSILKSHQAPHPPAQASTKSSLTTKQRHHITNISHLRALWCALLRQRQHLPASSLCVYTLLNLFFMRELSV